MYAFTNANRDWAIYIEILLYRLHRSLPGFITGLGPVDVRELTQTETVQTGWVSVAVHCDPGVAVGDLKRLADLLVQLKVSDGTPKLWCCKRKQSFSDGLTLALQS